MLSFQAGVSALRFSPSGALLGSGSKDTDIIMWDVVGETGLYRLRGHKDQVTDLVGCFRVRGMGVFMWRQCCLSQWPDF